MGTQGLREVATVLEQVLTDFGRRAADDPRRLKGLLTDTLGARASDLHDAIEIVVAAAEAGIPQAALGDTDRHALVDQARHHLSDPERAEEVVDIWIAALHVQDRIPTDGPTVAPPVEQTLAAGDPTQLPVSGDDPTRVIPVVGIPPAETRSGLRDRLTAFTTERKAVVFSAAGILVLALGSVGAAAMLSGNGDTATTTTTLAATTTTAVADDTTTTIAPLTAIDHEEYATSWGATVNRHWEISGDRLVKKVTVESGDEEISGTVWEMFPEPWGVDATKLSFITGDVMTSVYSNETAVRFVFAFPANSSWSYEYSIPLPPGGEDDPLFLETLLAEWELTMAEFLATPPPSLEITSDSPVGDQVTFRGSTTPGAEVQVDGKIIEVAEDGTFEHTAVLVPGDNLVVVRSVDRVRGQATIEELKWTYVPPTTPTVTTPPVTTPPVTTPPVTTLPPPPPPPPNQPPIYSCGSSFTLNGFGTSYSMWLSKSCFSDPDGDGFQPFLSQPSSGQIVAHQGTCQSTQWCWTYLPPSGWDGSTYSFTTNLTVTDDHGASSPSKTLTWWVNG